MASQKPRLQDATHSLLDRVKITKHTSHVIKDERPSPSIDSTDLTILKNSADNQDWHIIRKLGLSPICSICQQVLDRIDHGNQVWNGIYELIGTAIPVEERFQAGCCLCSLFAFYLDNSSIDTANFLYAYKQENEVFISLRKYRRDSGYDPRVSQSGGSVAIFRPVSSESAQHNLLYVSAMSAILTCCSMRWGENGNER
jgi:hypothetical protein